MRLAARRGLAVGAVLGLYKVYKEVKIREQMNLSETPSGYASLGDSAEAGNE